MPASERITSKAKKAPAKRAAANTTRTPQVAAGPSGWSRLKLQGDMTGLRAHDLVTNGVSVAAAKQVIAAFQIINETQFYEVLGISPKAMQWRSAGATRKLDPSSSDRALRLVSVISTAIDVLGSQEVAERWLCSPAIVWTVASPSTCCKAVRAQQWSRPCLLAWTMGSTLDASAAGTRWHRPVDLAIGDGQAFPELENSAGRVLPRWVQPGAVSAGRQVFGGCAARYASDRGDAQRR